MNTLEVPISEVNEFSEVVKTEEAVNLETARALSKRRVKNDKWL